MPDAVSLGDLKRIAEAGLKAPTGMNSQCVKLIILQGREAVAPLCAVAPTDGMLTAPSAIALLTDKYAQKGEVNFEMEDYSAAAENMLLAATALGYASLWLDSPYFDAEKQKNALAVLNAPAGFHLRVVLPVGLPDGEGSRREKLAFSERVAYGKWDK